jgi:hypothetical protein
VLARLPTVVVADVADIRAVAQHAMDFASSPNGLFRGEDTTFGLEFCHRHVQCAILEGVKMEDALHILGFGRFDSYNAATVLADADVAIWRHSREPSFAHA